MVRFPPSLTIACPLWSLVRSLGSPRDLRRGKTKLRGLIRGCSSGGGLESEPFQRRVRGAPSPQNPPETRGIPSCGLGPAQNGRCLGGFIGRKNRAGRTTLVYSGLGRTPSPCTPVSLHRVKEWMGSLGRELQQAVVSVRYSLIATSSMHLGFGVD